MAQTTGAISFKANKLEVSTDNTNWNDISGFSNEIEPDGGDRESGEGYTYDGDTAILTLGKRGPFNLKVKVVYTEGASDPQEVVRAAYESGSPLYLRWSPKGGLSGNFRYTTDAGFVISAPYPGGSAKSADPVMTQFTLKCAKVSKTVVP